MSPSKNTSAPLTEISPNTTSPTKPSERTDKDQLKMPETAAFPIRTDQTTNYYSPSDAMMSPTSKKLSELKGRRMAGSKQLSGRELFAKARALNDAKSNGSSESKTS